MHQLKLKDVISAPLVAKNRIAEIMATFLSPCIVLQSGFHRQFIHFSEITNLNVLNVSEYHRKW